MKNLIYYVEDDPDDAELFVNAAESLGVDVVHFYTCPSFLDYLAKGDKPTLIFLDSTVPGCNRDETIKDIRAKILMSDVPIVIYSGGVQPADRIRFQAMHRVAFDQKPCSLREISEIISRHINLNQSLR